jgi:hypothetical protein
MTGCPSPLSIETARYLQLRERIALTYPEVDDETLQDTPEGITDLHEMIAAVIRSALVGLASGLAHTFGGDAAAP